MKDIEAEGQKGEEDVDTEKEVVVERREERVDRAIGVRRVKAVSYTHLTLPTKA